MKKFYMIFSALLVVVYLLWSMFTIKNQILFMSFPSVDIMGTQPGALAVDRKSFTEELNQFALEEGSVIARRIVQPLENNQTEFVYELYGQGDLVSDMREASEKSAQESDLAASYLIIEGKVNPQEVVEKFESMGFSAYAFPPLNPISIVLSLIFKPTALLIFTLLLLTFISLTVVERIKDLRYTGIRLIAGRKIGTIMLEPFFLDLKYMSLLYILAIILGSLILFFLGYSAVQFFIIFSLGLFIYFMVLLIISFGLSFIYIIVLKKDVLLNILKGKLPVHYLMVIMLVGQFIAIVLVGYTVKEVANLYTEYINHMEAEKYWSDNGNLYQLSYNMTIDGGSNEESDRRKTIWYQLADEAVTHHDAMLVANNLKRFRQGDIVDGVHKNDYDPLGNTLFVTPNYLIKQAVKYEGVTDEELKELKEGEFGLLIPRSLKNQEQELVEKYTNYLNNFAREGLENTSPVLFDTHAKLGFLEDHQKRFIYNIDSSQQFLDDPIIVVLTPQSTGFTPSSVLFWTANLGGQMFFNGYDETLNLLRSQEVYPWISYVTNGRLKFLANNQTLRTELISLMGGAVIGILSAIMLFSTMNLLYFEKFRREIFIKRLSGMPFMRNHQSYLLFQLMTLGFAIILLFWLLKDTYIPLFTLMIFLLLASFILYRQLKREDGLAVTIMKGK